jgi:NAD-dependent SIR2 family protein deacetylase
MRNAISKNTRKNSTNAVFSSHVVNQAKLRLKNAHNDAVSVITTNWDIMLDNQINSIIQEGNILNGKESRGVLDYCCYISSLAEHDHSIESGLFVLGQGGYNVKVIKLHGSLNWLQCPRCNRLYVKLYKKWNGGYVFDKKYCYHCKKNYSEDDNDSILLNTSMVMPTFLKDLNNLQIKLSWMNAANELSEAEKVVFLGYSLSEADFEFKQLLSRMIRKDAVIDSVLIQDDNPENYDGKSKFKTAGYRFESFFSGRELNMYYDGVNKYVENL